MTAKPAPVMRLLDIIESDILPRTRLGVAAGNKVFGAAIIAKSTGEVIVAGTNNEMDNPLLHGEMFTLKKFYEIPANSRPDTRDCHFLSTHEPCTLCLSAITWAGFDNFHYLFSHIDSRDSFDIPHDLKILKEVFGLDAGGYRASNAYWQSFSIRSLVEELPGVDRAKAEAQIGRITDAYDALSAIYQDNKDTNAIPLN